jgi:indolepyruvate decarboxylase
MNDLLNKNTLVICDIGDSLFAASDLTIKARTEFLSPAYYTSMGFAVPAAIGAQMGRRRLRPLVFVGDGAFQMTGFELSTIARIGLNPIVFVMNNKGYTTERYIRDGAFNDIHNWGYHRLPDVLDAGWGAEVRTEGELEEALNTALKNRKAFSLVNVHLDPYDRSDSLERLGKWIGKTSVIE